MNPRKSCALIAVFLSVPLICSSAFAAVGYNSNLDGNIFVPLSDSGFLGSNPSGFGQVSDSIQLEGGDSGHGKLSFFLSYVIDEEELPSNFQIMVDTAQLALVLTDADFRADRDMSITVTETFTAVLVADGPEDPANPGSFTPDPGAPSFTIDATNYLTMQSGTRVSNTDDTTIDYTIMFSDFLENPAGPTVAEIGQDINDDREFALLITLTTDTFNRTSRTQLMFNTPEAIDLSVISFEALETPEPAALFTLSLGFAWLVRRRAA